MAKYTIELRRIVENGIRIFPFHYEFYDEKKRLEFEDHFIKHFYFNEIGQETVERFIHCLENKMHTVFPYYNELFKTAQIEYSILDNYKLNEKTTIKRENTEKATGVSSSKGQATNTDKTTSNGTSKDTDRRNGENTKNGKQIDRFTESPQGRVDLDDNKYLTTLKQADTVNDKNVYSEDATSNHTTSDTSNRTGKDEHSENTNTVSDRKQEHNETLETLRVGNIGIDTDADMIQKHIKLQQILKKIEIMFFEECEDLFMLVY